MGGKAVVAELIKFDPEVKAIVLRGYLAEKVLSDYKKYGFCDMISKRGKIGVAAFWEYFY